MPKYPPPLEQRFAAKLREWEQRITRIEVAIGRLADGAVTETKVADGAITADKISATAIDGKTITGATITTTGGDIVIDDTQILIQDASGSYVKIQDEPTNPLGATAVIILNPPDIDGHTTTPASIRGFPLAVDTPWVGLFGPTYDGTDSGYLYVGVSDDGMGTVQGETKLYGDGDVTISTGAAPTADVNISAGSYVRLTPGSRLYVDTGYIDLNSSGNVDIDGSTINVTSSGSAINLTSGPTAGTDITVVGNILLDNNVEIDGTLTLGAIADAEAEINGKAASSHTHAESDITNLTTDLAAKITQNAWANYGPTQGLTWSSASNPQPSLGSGTLIGNYVIIGKTLIQTVYLKIAADTSLGTGAWSFSSPVSLASTGSVRAHGSAYVLRSGGNFSIGTTVSGASSHQAVIHGAASACSPTVPFAWTTNDYLYFTAIAETT